MPQADREAMRAESAEVLVMARSHALRAMDEGRAGSIGDVVKVEQRLAALLGLDAPTELVVHNPTATELDQWVAAMVRQSMPSLVEADVIDVDSDEVGVGIQIVEDGIGVLDVLGADRDGDEFSEIDPALAGDFASGGDYRPG